MMQDLGLLLALAAWFALAYLAAHVASAKGRDGLMFFLLAVLLSPVVGLIAAFVAQPNKRAVESARLKTGDARKCPSCAELIKREARVCRYCGRDVANETPQAVAGYRGRAPKAG